MIDKSQYATILDSTNKLIDLKTDLYAQYDSLNLAISKIDEKLKKLSLGVSAWVVIQTAETGERALGYSKIGGHWGLALRIGLEEKWVYSQVPTHLRLEAVSKFPELFEALVRNTMNTIEQLKIRTEQIKEIVSAMEEVETSIVT